MDNTNQSLNPVRALRILFFLFILGVAMPALSQDTDTDTDGIADIDDVDDDNDGILDTVECGAPSKWDTNGNSSGTGGQSAFLSSGVGAANVSISTVDGQFSNNGNSDYISISERTAGNGTYTVAFSSPVAGLKFYIRDMGQRTNSNARLGDFSATLEDGTVLENLYFNVLPTTEDFPGSGTGNTEVVEKIILNGTHYIQDPTPNGGSQEAYGLLEFPAFSELTTLGKSVTSISFATAGDGQGSAFFAIKAYVAVDSDGDDLLDCYDLDSDGDGCSDADEAYGNTDADGNDGGQYGTGTPPPVNADGSVTAASYPGTNSAVTNADISTTCTAIDFDGDLVQDADDVDDDNDGILDTVECGAPSKWDTNGNSSGTGGQSAFLSSGVGAANVSISTVDGQFSNNGNSDYISISERTAGNGTYTVAFSSPVAGLKFYVRDMGQRNNSNARLGDFSATLEDGTVLENLAFYVLPTTEDFPGSGTGNTEVVEKIILNGTHHIQDPTPNGGSQEAYGLLEFPAFSELTTLGKSVTSISFTTTGDGQGSAFFAIKAYVAVDSDGDDLLDCYDLDSDGDGCSDADEAYGNTDADGNDGGQYGTGTPPPVDADGSVIAASYPGTNSAVTNAGISTTCTAIDFDGDLVQDADEVDDDNDGILDTVECGAPSKWDTNGNSSGTGGQSAFLSSGVGAANVSISTVDGQFSNNGNSDYISISERTAGNGTYTVAFSSPVAGLKLYVRDMGQRNNSNARLGDFSATLEDGTVLENLAFYVLPTTEDFPGSGTGNTEVVEKIVLNGTHYIQDPTPNGGSQEAYGLLAFPAFSELTTFGKSVASISFTTTGDGQGSAFFAIKAYVAVDSDGDDLLDCYDLDSDGDGCSDADEAYGNTDADGNDGGQYGTGTPPPVDADGSVTGASYPTPRDGNANGQADFLEVGGVPVITVQPSSAKICLDCDATFSVVSDGNTYQWQILVGAVWTDLANGVDYSGVTSDTLTVLSANKNENGDQFRVLVTNNAYVCGELTSSTATLNTMVNTVITNRRITVRVNKN